MLSLSGNTRGWRQFYRNVTASHLRRQALQSNRVPTLRLLVFLLHEAKTCVKYVVANNTTTLCQGLFSTYLLSNLMYVNPKRHPLVFNHF